MRNREPLKQSTGDAPTENICCLTISTPPCEPFPWPTLSHVEQLHYSLIPVSIWVFKSWSGHQVQGLLLTSIEVCIPKKEDRELVAKRIFEELELGIVKEETLKEFQDLISKMKEEQQIEAVILGCTELPLLLNENNCPLPVLDSVEIHIRKLVELAMWTNCCALVSVFFWYTPHYESV